MATLSQVLTVFQEAIISAVSGLTLSNVYPGWPQPEQLSIELRGGITNITIYPANMGDRRTQVAITDFKTVQDPIVTLTAVQSAIQLQGGTNLLAATGTITFSGVAAEGCNMLIKVNEFYVSVEPAAATTAAQVAAQYAAKINADPSVSPIVIASAIGAVLTLTAVAIGTPGNAIPFWVRIGGTGLAARKIKRQKAQIQVHVWAANNDDRDLFADTLDTVLSGSAFLLAADTTPVRVLYERSHQDDREVPLGVYRRILTYSAEYDTLDYVPTYTILADNVTVGT